MASHEVSPTDDVKRDFPKYFHRWLIIKKWISGPANISCSTPNITKSYITGQRIVVDQGRRSRHLASPSRCGIYRRKDPVHYSRWRTRNPWNSKVKGILPGWVVTRRRLTGMTGILYPGQESVPTKLTSPTRPVLGVGLEWAVGTVRGPCLQWRRPPSSLPLVPVFVKSRQSTCLDDGLACMTTAPLKYTANITKSYTVLTLQSRLKL